MRNPLAAIFLLILFFLFLWGWILLGLIGLLVLATVVRSTRRTCRTIVALSMILVASGWFQLVRPIIIGVDYQCIQTQDGSIKAALRQKGFVGYWLVISEDSKEKCIHLTDRTRPKQIFWIQEGKTIGVEYPKGGHQMVDVETLLDPTINSRRLSAEEELRLDHQRKLNLEEEKLFEAAKQAALENRCEQKW